jgi:hypothetical protein
VLHFKSWCGPVTTIPAPKFSFVQWPDRDPSDPSPISLAFFWLGHPRTSSPVLIMAEKDPHFYPFKGPEISPEQLREAFKRLGSQDWQDRSTEDIDLVNYVTFDLTPEGKRSLPRKLETHPAAALLLDQKVQKLGILRARIENIRAAIFRDTYQNCSALPALLVAAPVIAVPCTQLFAEEYYKDINKILLLASRMVSERTISELERIRLILEAEYNETLKSWQPSDEEWEAVRSIVESRTDHNITLRDRTSPENPAFVIPPDVTKGHTLITPNPELRTLNKTTGRIPGKRRSDQRGRRTSHGGYYTPVSETGSRTRESPVELGRMDHQSPDLGFRRRNQQSRRPRT